MTKQSAALPRTESGLLRFARNDDAVPLGLAIRTGIVGPECISQENRHCEALRAKQSRLSRCEQSESARRKTRSLQYDRRSGQ